jgi:hypothetical protein
MHWVSGNNRYGDLEHRLEISEPCDLDAAYIAFWRRLLDDAVAHVGQWNWHTIAFELSPKESPDERPGWLKAHFWDASNRLCKHPDYVMPSSAFVVLDEDQGDEKHARDLLVFFLEHFDRLRAAAIVEPVASLFQRVQALRPLQVLGAVNDGWLDLQIGQPEPGPLPEYDQKLLAGEPARMQSDPGGLWDMEWLALLNAVGNALIHYTPEHFKTIECTVRVEGDRLFYQIGCPDFPEEGATEPGKDVHQAMSRLMTHKNASDARIPGMRFVVQIESDGSARTHVEILHE